MKRLVFTLAAIASPLCSISAQANVGFTGGSGSQLVMTLFAPIKYTITSNTASPEPLFVFVGTGHTFMSFQSVLSTMTYSVNGAGSFPLSWVTSGITYGAPLTENDTYFGGYFQSLAIGDIVRLNAGTFTTVDPFAAAAPASGQFQTYIVDSRADIRSGFGVTTVPEPGTTALVAAGLLGIVALRRWRARRQQCGNDRLGQECVYTAHATTILT